MKFETRDKLSGTPSVYLMVGCSRTGKTRWANYHHHHTNSTIVSRDDIRRAMGVEYEEGLEPFIKLTEHYMSKALLLRGQNIIVDGTHLTITSRSKWIEKAKNSEIKLFITWFHQPIDHNLWNDRCVESKYPWAVIQEQLERIEGITDEEALYASVSEIESNI